MHLITQHGGNNMYEYVKGKAMWANITSPNTRFEPHKYGLTVLTDQETATKLEGLGLTQVRSRTGELKYEEPAFTFSSRATNNDGTARTAPKLFDNDGNSLDVSVGNGSEVTVKIKPYKNNYGRFAELIAVKVDNLVEYSEADSDNEEF
jgi:hypothetical protein